MIKHPLQTLRRQNPLRPPQQYVSIRILNPLAHLCIRRPEFELDLPQQYQSFSFLTPLLAPLLTPLLASLINVLVNKGLHDLVSSRRGRQQKPYLFFAYLLCSLNIIAQNRLQHLQRRSAFQHLLDQSQQLVQPL